MSTLIQIESAVTALPPDEQWSLLGWLRERLTAPTASPAQPQPRSAEEIQRWLMELDELKASTHTGKSGVPLQQIMDDIRDERF